MSSGSRLVCECTYDLATPWDRFCAGCGRSLTGEGKLIVVPTGQKVDNRDKVSFRIANNAPVSVNVKIPHVAADTRRLPPKWLVYDIASGGAQDFELAPGASRVVSFGIRREVIEEMLREPGGRDRAEGKGVGAVSYDLRLFTDADYRKQDHAVTLSLIGQADLRPEAIEFPSVWLTNPGVLRVPLRLFNASGEEMSIEHLRTHIHDDDAVEARKMREVVDALFPESVFAAFRNRLLPPGEFVDVTLETRPITAVLERLTRELGPRFVDPYEKRRTHWIERWPALTRVRFVVEATLQARGPDAVPPVRSLVVLTLVRPPLVRDRTPEDQLWQRVGGSAGVNGVFRVDDGEVIDLVADLVNDSAMPVMLKRVTVNRPWLTVVSAHEDRVLAPGAMFNLQVKVDLALRAATELREAHLSAQVQLETWPPTPLQRVDDIHIEAPSTIMLPGCLGVDFGTSNCAMCFMPDGDLPDGHSGIPIEPVSLPLEQVLDDVFDTMPSVMWRRRNDDPSAKDPEFMFGRDAEASEVQRPANAVRGIKRILTRGGAFEFKLVTDDANNPIKTYAAKDLAGRMLLHLMQQIRTRSVSWRPLRQRLHLTASAGIGVPSAEDLANATSFRFGKAVFTHPVDASDELKRALYDCAVTAGLAYEVEDGEQRVLDYEAFARTRLIDESSAAISAFVFSHESRLSPTVSRILCLDVGGGTTDISAVEFRPVVRFKEGDRIVTRPTLDLIFRRGINDFAGMDIDRAIVMRCFVARMNEKLRGPTQGAQIDSGLLESALRGDSANVLAQSVRHLVGADQVAAAVEFLGEAARLLVREAERVKIRAGTTPTETLSLRFSSSAIPPLVRDGALHADGGARLDLHIEIPLVEVNELIAELVRARLPILDQAVRKARWGWSGVDLIMFTGQTCRAPALQAVVLEHVQKARGGTLPTLVVPSTALPVGVSADVISFDPKMCVPAGAALRGYKAAGRRIDRLQLRLRPQANKAVTAGRDLVLRGDPLPAFCAAAVHVDSERFVVVEVGDHQSVVTVPASIAADVLTVVIDEAETCWLVQTAAEGEAAVDVPAAVSDAVALLPAEFRVIVGVTGSIVTWCQRIDGGAS